MSNLVERIADRIAHIQIEDLTTAERQIFELLKTEGYCVERDGEVETFKKEVKELDFADQFSRFVNGSRHSVPKMVEKCLKEHPTLQQGMMRFCVEFIEGMATKERPDGRNEASVKLAKQFVAACPNRALPLI